MKKLRTQEMILAAVFAALLAVLSQISFPLPSGVPVTLQTFAVALCGFTLGSSLGAISIAVYLVLGAIGIPVFAGFHGGIGAFVGMTGGFLWGFLAMAALCGTRKPLLAALGLIACHVPGILQFSLVSGTPVLQSATLVSVPFLIKDAASIAVALITSRAVRRGLTAARLYAR